MIQASELRIGNWVDFLSKEEDSGGNMCGTRDTMQVDINDISHSVEYPDMYDPVPLTPDILEKCGFVLDQEYWEPFAGEAKGKLFETKMGPRLQIMEDHKSGLFFRLIAGGDSPDEYGWYDCEIKSLHQLQNLFFSLTGEELNINL